MFKTLIYLCLVSITCYGQKPFDLSKKINSFIETNELPGMVVMVVQKKKTVHFESYGYSDIENKVPMKKDNIFHLYSMTKPLTALAFLKFTSENGISLDSHLQTYYPEFDSQPLIPLKNILTHSAGFAYGFNIRRWAGYRYLFSGIGSSENLPEFMETLSGLPLFWEPNYKWRYSYSSDILGAFIEKVGNVPFDDYMREQLFKPLKMKSSDFHIVDKARYTPMHSDGWFSGMSKDSDEPDEELFRKTKGASGGSGVFSTAEDYMKFLQLLLYPEEYSDIIDPKRVYEMRKDQIGHLEKGVPERIYPNTGYSYGLGIKTKEEEYLPKGSFYWAGLAGTIFWVDPEKELCVVVMCQIMKYRKEIEEKFIPLIYDWLE